MNEEQERQWREHVEMSLAYGRCPHSGYPGPRCKETICDCFDYEEMWGPSKK